MVDVATSFLEVKKENVIKTIYDLEVAGTNYFHIDVMDGQFVKNNTVDIMREYTEYIKQVANTKTEVHLMVKDIESYVKAYVDMEVNCITFHLESLKSENEILKIISYIKQNNIQVGLAISPNTNIEEVYKYLPYIHRVLIMTVEPGMGGQKLIPETVKKIKELNIFAYENNFDIDIEVDGGINEKTARTVIDAGANILVAGSYIINSDNFKDAIKKIRE